MKKFIALLLLVSTNVFAWDSSSAYNTIAMSYNANTTITQIINLNSTQQAATTINFEVDVKNGGGRPTHDLNGNPLAYSSQTDSATITIYRYNSSGQLIGTTASQTYILKNLGSDPGNGFSTAPGDNKHPFTQASVTYSGSLADTAYIKIEMKGTDGAWWAGNYGAQWRTPTVTVGSSATNIVYNSEFGVAPNGVQAQGWTPSYGSWSPCGVTSGSNTCVTQQSGVTANMWGGGYDVNGGTTSGTSGGYSGTLTSDNATQAAAGTITPGTSTPPAPTVTGTTTTYTTRNVVNGNTTTVYRTPVTTTTYSDGTSTQTNGTETLYQTKVSSTITTNKIVGNTLTTYTTPINTVTTVGQTGTTIESNGAVIATTQTVQQGLNFQVWRYDPKNYSCFLGVCAWNFTFHTPSTNINDYGNTVNIGVTNNGMYLQTNGRLPNNDGSFLGYNDGTVIRYTGTITAPITATHPAGTVYRLYFYNQTDDGFVLRINGNTIINNSETNQWQAIGNNYNSNGWIDVVAGQSYNLEAWYWNVDGGVGHRFFWDYGDGIKQVNNTAFTTGTISSATIDTTGLVYSNSSIVNVSGTAIVLGPTVEGGTITQTNSPGNEIITSGGGSTAGISTDQQTRVNTWTNRTPSSYNNELYIQQSYGTNNTVTIVQEGTANKMEFSLGGNNNVVNTNQVGSNYLKQEIPGWGNNVNIIQNNTSLTNYAETKLQGNGNTANHTQTGPGNHILFNVVTGDINTVNTTQTGSAGHYAETKLTGNHNNVIVNQSGSTQNKANIDLTNAGGAASVDLQQTGGKNFTIIQSCANPAGCSTTIRQ